MMLKLSEIKKADKKTDFQNVSLCYRGTDGTEDNGTDGETAYLKAIEANDTVSMRNIAFSQDFFSFLEVKKQSRTVRNMNLSSSTAHHYLNVLIN